MADKVPRKISRRTAIKMGIGALAGYGLARGFFLEPHGVRLETVQVDIEGLGANFDGYRVGLLSDFHIPHFVSVDYIQRCIRILLESRPDIILCLGDFCNSKGVFGVGRAPVPEIEPYLAGLSAPDGVFGVLGNHDYWLSESGVKAQVAKTSVRLLHNENLVLTRGSSELAIIGTPDLWEADIRLEDAFTGIAPSTPRILMQHNPDFAEQFPQGFRVDLQVSGHTHGGQVRLPFGPALILPSKYGNKYREGLVAGPRHRVYVTRGVGMSSTLPVRFCCPPEVTILTLTRR